MTNGWALAALLALVALAGCLDGADAPPGNASDASGTVAGSETTLLYLDSDGSLAPDPGNGGHAPIGWSVPDWMAGRLAPSWQSTPWDTDRLLTSANVTIEYVTAAPVGHSDTRPPFTIWFGTTGHIIEHAFAAGPNPWLPGEDQTIAFPVDDLPLGGLVVEAGESLQLFVGSYYTEGLGAGPISVALGGQSFIEFSSTEVELPSAVRQLATDRDSELVGGRCVTDLNQLGTAMESTTFEVAESAVGISVHLTRTQGIGMGPDLDMSLLAPDGTVVSHAAGSAGVESLHLRAPNMKSVEQAGTWSVTVYNCHPQASTYHLSVELLLPPI